MEQSGTNSDARKTLDRLRELLGPVHGEAAAALDDLAALVEVGAEARAVSEHFHEMLTHSSTVHYRLNVAQDRYDYVSPSITELTGIPRERFLRMRMEEVVELFHPQDFAGLMQAVEQVAPKGPGRVPVAHEYRVRDSQGRWRWCSDHATYFFDDFGHVTAVVGTVVDITRQREAEAALRESEQRYRLLAANSEDAIAIFDLDMRLTYASPSVERLMGWPPETLLAMRFEDFMTDQALQVAREGFGRRMAMERAGTPLVGSQRNEMLFRTKAGSTVWTECVTTPLRDEQGRLKGVLVVARDIGKRKEAQEALAREEAKYRLLVENQTDLVVKVDTKGRFLYVSPSYCRAFGKSEEELLQGTFMPQVHPEDLPETLAAMEALYEPPHSAVMEQRCNTVDGWRWFSWTDTAVLDESGQVSAIIGVGRDVTEKKVMEAALLAAKEQAEAASRAKDEFLANMSHEIRNPLNAVLGLADLMLLDDLSAAQRERATLLKNSGSTLLGIINEILDFSKIEAGNVVLELERFDPVALVSGLCAEQRVLADEKDVELRLSIDPRLPREVVGDGGKVRQILLNLVGNAIKFTDEGFVEVIAKVQERDGSAARLLFAVADSGIGIPKDKQDAVFESFRQVDSGLRKRHAGTGLGLAICKRLTAMLGGDIWLESEPGQGSIFCFAVPVEGVSAVENGSSIGPFPADMPSMTVLVVDDDWVNRRFTCQLLQRHGHGVIEAGNGLAALEKLRQGGVDMVLLDMQMPVMDGITATRAIRGGAVRSMAQVPIIGLTAYAASEDRQRFLAAGVNACLAKPLRMERLLAVMRDLFAGQSVTEGDVEAQDENGQGQEFLDERLVADHLHYGRESFAELLDAFESDARAHLAGMSPGSAAASDGGAATSLHLLAGGAAVVGARALWRRCCELECAARAGNVPAAGETGALADLLRKSLKALRARL